MFFGLDPRLIAVFCGIFIIMGAFYAYAGYRQLQKDRAQGLKAIWYKQIRILTGTEYILIALVFLLNLGIVNKWFPASLTPILSPVYTVALIAAAILAGIVIYQSLRNPPRRAAPATAQPKAQELEEKEGKTDAMTPQQKAEYMRKRRERRQRAAEARRKRAGKA